MDIQHIARGIVFRGDTVLLCKNLKHGYLYLPGGHIEEGEDAQAALEREFFEEAGIEIFDCKEIAQVPFEFEQNGKLQRELNVVFTCSTNAEEIVSKEAHIAFEFVALADIGSRDVRPSVLLPFIS